MNIICNFHLNLQAPSNENVDRQFPKVNEDLKEDKVKSVIVAVPEKCQ